MKMLTLAISAIPAAAIFGALLLGSGESAARDEQSRARAAIKLCWEEYERKSLDPQTKRFVASTCEMMERDFQKKFGRRP